MKIMLAKIVAVVALLLLILQFVFSRAVIEVSETPAPGKTEQFGELRAQGERKPNIIMLFADDLGYGDLASYGHPYAKTPNLDKLAAEGTLFRKFNVTGTSCSPSRAGFMTSRHPNSFPFKTRTHGLQGRVTVTDLMKQAGYKTGHFGKWDIGPDKSDGTYGIDEIIESGGGGVRNPRGRDEKIYQDAIAFIKANKDVPFYANVWGRVTHNPVNPRPELVARAGFRDLKIDRSKFQGQQLQGVFDWVEKSGGDINKSMASYLTEVFYLDQFVGDLLSELDKLGLRDNTIVVFSSDQGAAHPVTESYKPGRENQLNNLVGYSGGLRGQKHDEYEGSIRSPFIIRWPGHIPAGKINHHSITSALDWLPTLSNIANVKIDPKQFHGEDVLDIWLGSERSREGPQFWNNSMKKDDWRIYFKGDWRTFFTGSRKKAVELYDLSTDPAETKNLVNERPKIVAQLTAIWKDWNESLPVRR